MIETEGQRRTRQALALFNGRPSDTRKGETAGSRREGIEFRKQMINALGPSADTEVTTTIGKSTERSRIDGSAVDRLSYKLVRFVRTSKKGTEFIVAVNSAFQLYDSDYWAEILEQTAWLNSKSDGGTIRILQTEDDYRAYITSRFGK